MTTSLETGTTAMKRWIVIGILAEPALLRCRHIPVEL